MNLREYIGSMNVEDLASYAKRCSISPSYPCKSSQGSRFVNKAERA
ncbi:hypothetical protein CFBP2118_03301 [Pseudomonas syringae pv. syringae]|nr:hypothetical protein CFBP2118_03301 [Pseudomonas syringae pv. syringae]